MNHEQLAQLKILLDRELDSGFEGGILDWETPGIEFLKFTHSPSDAHLGEPSDGVRFSINYSPTCYRRGPWKLLIEVNGGEGHFKWGCFDDQDQPVRYFHRKESLLVEADEIARVLIIDRVKAGPIGKAQTSESGQSHAIA